MSIGSVSVRLPGRDPVASAGRGVGRPDRVGSAVTAGRIRVEGPLMDFGRRLPSDRGPFAELCGRAVRAFSGGRRRSDCSCSRVGSRAGSGVASELSEVSRGLDRVVKVLRALIITDTKPATTHSNVESTVMKLQRRVVRGVESRTLVAGSELRTVTELESRRDRGVAGSASSRMGLAPASRGLGVMLRSRDDSGSLSLRSF